MSGTAATAAARVPNVPGRAPFVAPLAWYPCMTDPALAVAVPTKVPGPAVGLYVKDIPVILRVPAVVSDTEVATQYQPDGYCVPIPVAAGVVDALVVFTPVLLHP